MELLFHRLLGNPSLTLTCSKCTRQTTVVGQTEGDCDEAASKAGWVMAESGRMICPRCPAVRPAKQHTKELLESQEATALEKAP